MIQHCRIVSKPKKKYDRSIHKSRLAILASAITLSILKILCLCSSDMNQEWVCVMSHSPELPHAPPRSHTTPLCRPRLHSSTYFAQTRYEARWVDSTCEWAKLSVIRFISNVLRPRRPAPSTFRIDAMEHLATLKNQPLVGPGPKPEQRPS
ncbi:hypothetical protein DFH29DRAFT_970936 [Suillus ampliporus]|nr:hypothetical protein DFH29DRAFT_970936 [Suillus ampliporus]